MLPWITLTPSPSPTGAGEGRCSVPLQQWLCRQSGGSRREAGEKGQVGEGQRQRRKGRRGAETLNAKAQRTQRCLGMVIILRVLCALGGTR